MSVRLNAPQKLDAVQLLLAGLAVVSFATHCSRYIPKIFSNSSELVPVVGLQLLATFAIVVLVVLLDRERVRREPGQISLWAITMVLSVLITLWLAAQRNNQLSALLESAMPRQLIQDWEPALVGPFVEETVKGIVVFALIVVFRERITRPLHTVYVGMFAGLGFQFTEDIGYALNSAFEHLVSDFEGGRETVLLRALSGISTHWIYTTVFALGISYLMGISYQSAGTAAASATHRTQQLALGVSLIVVSIMLHFLWNSPLEFGLGVASLLLKFLVSVTVLAVTLRIILQAEIRWKKNNPGDLYCDRPDSSSDE